MTDKYYELRLSINPLMEDIISEIFFDNFDCEGVVLAEETYKDLEMVSTTEGTLRIFLKNEYGDSFEDLKYDIENVLDLSREEFLSRGLSEEELGSWDFVLEEKKSEDWSKKWKEHWKPTKASEHVIICPSWEECEQKKDEIIITLDPGSAFGTGTHATTQLCIRAIEKYVKKGYEVADIGTGSGILAITAIKFGATHAVGIDNDPLVIDVAQDNAQVNGVFNKIDFSCATADMLTEQYDFVCANILHNVLADIMGDLKNILKPDAHMVLSGILDEKKPVVIEAVNKHGLKTIETMQQDQWIAIVVQKA